MFDQVRDEPELTAFLATQPASLLQAIHTWEHTDIPTWVAERNQRFLFLAAERIHMKDFFDEIEKSPLTEEQITSVAMCDNSVRVIAAAGSGKTSTMVARAGYTLARGIAEPGQILMLAFNKAAAAELHQRVVERLQIHALEGEQIKATTFHSFGLEVIGQATGRKPRVPGDLVDLNGAKRMERVIDRLRDRDETFRRTWDLFRLVFGQPLSDFGAPSRPEDHDKITGIRGYRTLNDEVVKSQEERLIANWLFYHGVRYEYERPYEVNTATARYGQYHPDFYYPDIDAYHEHWAIGRDGNPPPTFKGYREGMRWKQQMHQAHGTTLLETTSASVRDGSGFDYLGTQLRAHGLVIDDSYHEIQHIPGRAPIADASIIRLFRTVLAPAKSNQLSSVDLRERATPTTGRIPIRTELFLQLYQTIHQEWQRQLAAANQVDFDDMLNQASEIIESGRWANPYTMVLVDEMQDSSCAEGAPGPRSHHRTGATPSGRRRRLASDQQIRRRRPVRDDRLRHLVRARPDGPPEPDVPLAPIAMRCGRGVRRQEPGTAGEASHLGPTGKSAHAASDRGRHGRGVSRSLEGLPDGDQSTARRRRQTSQRLRARAL